MGYGRVRGKERVLAGSLVCGWLLAFGFSRAAVLEVPGKYSTIQEAVDAAVDGDGIRVDPSHEKESLQIIGKGVSLYSAVPGEKVGSGRVLIQNAGIVKVRDFSVEVLPYDAFTELFGCVQAYDTERIEVVDCALIALYIPDYWATAGLGTCGVWGQTVQEIHIEGCTLQGSVGPPGFLIAPSLSAGGGNGGHGLRAIACPTVGLFDSTLTAGDGGEGIWSYDGSNLSGGGPGGCGVQAEDHSHVFATACTLEGGVGGFGEPYGPDGLPVCLESTSTFTTATPASSAWVLYP